MLVAVICQMVLRHCKKLVEIEIKFIFYIVIHT